MPFQSKHILEDDGGYPDSSSNLKVISKRQIKTIIYNWNEQNRLLIGVTRLDELIRLINTS